MVSAALSGDKSQLRTHTPKKKKGRKEEMELETENSWRIIVQDNKYVEIGPDETNIGEIVYIS